MKKVTIKAERDQWILEGPLTCKTVMAALESLRVLLSKEKAVVVNLAAVSAADSAGLAFLIALLKEAKLKQMTIRFTHLPKQIHDLAVVSGVAHILPIVAS